ncbi:MAG: hypothetical protein CMF41_04005 [Legionellales bacterium]|nr:hypothetical protein [Legionellales bacterium]|tara:strand:- start:1563 stop:2546 length:984 start_codon:yes stop_codon:yes gene_type:complete
MKEFKTQKEAYENVSQEEFTYAVNYKNSAASFYVNATEKEFWDEYMLKGPKNNYEIIKMNKECHLYLDLDKHNSNYSEDIEDIWNIIKEKMIGALVENSISKNNINFIKLSSHSDTKQSLHIIVKIKGKIFKDLSHCGFFIKELLNDIPVYYHQVIDTAVYTKNRCFRMLGCTKAGQQRYLVGENPLSFEYWKECKIQPLKWNGDEKSRISFDGVPETLPNTFSSEIPAHIIFIFQMLNQDKHFLAHSGPVDLNRIFSIPESLTFVCNTLSRKCPIAERYHTTNVPYVVIDLLRQKYYFKCRSEKNCRGLKTREYRLTNVPKINISF